MPTKFLRYQQALTRRPSAAMAEGITTQAEAINLDLARQQHANYIAALNELQIEVTVLPADNDFPDSHFVEDAAIICCKKAILTRPGAKARLGEVARMAQDLKTFLPIQELGGNKDATLDGGDVLFFGQHVLIGISYRTNREGALALGQRLQAIDPTLTIHLVEFSGVLHLKSGLVALNDQILLGNPRMKLRAPLPVGEIIWLPEDEGYAANALIANDTAFIFAECKETQARVKEVGLRVVPLDMSEFRKMDGSFTCLSLLW